MNKSTTLYHRFLILMLWIFSFSLFGQNTESKIHNASNEPELDTLTAAKIYDFPQVDVIGRKPSLLNRIPGSANIITEASLKISKPITGNEMFRKVTGVNVVDEEGAGLRANIGIRGLDPDRSRNVLMMEDGIPIALAPYGEPEMYYTPAIDRMKSIEVLKGSGSILYGPQTVGGVINYITNDPPLNPTLSLSLRGGDGGYFNGQAGYGTTDDNVGFQFGLLHKQADRLGITRFDINDLTAKIRFQTSENSRIGIKLAFYDENSNSTYVGLTQSMYDNGEYFTIISPNDELDIRRYSANLTHDYFFSNNAFLRTTVYGYTTTRNWLRQDFSRSPVSNGTGVVFGDTTISGGAIYMRNSTGNRNRQFEVAGIEPRIHFNYLLAVWEVLIGLGLIFGVFMRATLFLLFAQLLGTVTPLFLLPHEVFTHFPYALTLKGQYIIKHQHTENGFLLIQFLSHFLTTVLFLAFSIEVYKKVLRKHILKKNKENFFNLFFSCSNGLRAPPLNIHN